jgi:hypothetical protein
MEGRPGWGCPGHGSLPGRLPPPKGGNDAAAIAGMRLEFVAKNIRSPLPLSTPKSLIGSVL